MEQFEHTVLGNKIYISCSMMEEQVLHTIDYE